MTSSVVQNILSTSCTSFETLYLNQNYEYLAELSDSESGEAGKDGELKLSPFEVTAAFQQQDNSDQDDDIISSESSVVKIKSREFHPNGSDLHLHSKSTGEDDNDKELYGEESFGQTELFRPLLTPSERIMLGISPVPEFFQYTSEEDDIQSLSRSLNLSSLSISSKTMTKNKGKIKSMNIKDSLTALVTRNKPKTRSFQRFKRFRPKGSQTEPSPDKLKRYMRNEYGYSSSIAIHPRKRVGYFRRMLTSLQAAFRHFSQKSTS